MTPVNSLIPLLDRAGVPLLALLGLWATVVLGLAWLVVKSLRQASSSVR